MPNSSQSFDHLSDTPYTRQLQTGLSRLRFSEALEQQYRQHLKTDQEYAHRIAIILALVVWLLFAVLDFQKLNLIGSMRSYSAQLWYLLAVRWGVLLMIAAAGMIVFTRRVGSHGPQITMLTLFMIGLASTFCLIIYDLLDVSYAASVQLLVIAACFFPIGLVFYQNLAVALAITAIYSLAGIVLIEDPHSPFLQQIPILFLSVLVAAVGGYTHEYTRRMQFLLRHQLDWQAAHDALTGLFNRRSFDRHLQTSLRQAAREKIEMALMLLDIDHFKLFNDHYGHPQGDAALCQVAELLQRIAKRPMDMAVRLGGEEFAVLLYDVDARQAARKAEELREAVKASGIPHATSPTATCLSVSIGLLSIAEHGTPEDLYRRADQLLYQAKREGRDRVAVAV